MGLDVPDVSNDGQLYGLLVQGLGRSRAANPIAILQAGMFCDGVFGARRTVVVMNTFRSSVFAIPLSRCSRYS
jgi:hypothetical protein